MMDDPNITMEEYIKLQAEKAQRRDFEAEYPAIVYNDELTSNENVSSEPTIWHHYYLGLRGICGLDARLIEEMGETLTDRMRMVYTREDGHVLFTSEARRRMTWREFILALDLNSAEEMAEDGFEAYWLGSTRAIPDKGDLRDYWTEISSDRDFLGASPSYTYIRDPVRRLCHRRAEGRKSGTRLLGGYFIGRLAGYFGLVSDEGLMGLTIIAREPPMIDMDKLVKLNICVSVGNPIITSLHY
ncbi:hypothetical protein Tco_0371711 [Tanacetum coccineum]